MSSIIVKWANRILILALILAMVPTAHAVTRRTFGFTPASGYIAFGVINRSLAGDFDGETFYYAYDYYGSEWISIVPDFESGTGLKGTLGYRSRMAGLEFSGAYTKHSGIWVGVPTDGSFLTLGFDLLIYMNNRAQVQPFLQLGVMYQNVNVEDGSAEFYYDSFTDETYLVAEGDGSFRGVGGRFGGGVQFYMNKTFSIRAAALFRIGSLNRAKMVGAGELIELDEGIGTGGASFYAQAVFGFGRPAS